MKNWIWLAALLASFTIVKSAYAVQLDPGGQGQVLLYPYYTVHNGQQTLVSIINTSDADQVLQVSFREALNGRSALQFKVWLGRKDTWTGTVFAERDAGLDGAGAAVLTRDTSCTTPLFSASGRTLSDGTPYVQLTNGAYSGTAEDGGQVDAGRARHGWIEVIALANVSGIAASAMTFTGAGLVPDNCGILQNVVLDSTTSGRPSGAIAGASSVIRVVSGTILSSRAEALSGFTEVSLYNIDAMQLAPNLASVNEGTPGGAVSAMVVDDQGRKQVLTYGAPGSGSRPIDAVSASLMATKVKNEYQTSAALGASTDWVMTMPTKRFYTDPGLIGASSAAMPPFDEMFQAPGVSRQCAPFRMFSQDQRTTNGTYTTCSLTPPFFPGTFPRPPIVALAQSANVVPFFDVSWYPIESGVLAAPAPRIFTPFLDWHIRPNVAPAGWLEINLAPINFSHRLPASAEGKVLTGLPTIGFSASNIINNNVSNGVLANYAAAVRHVSAVTCVKASDGTPCD